MHTLVTLVLLVSLFALIACFVKLAARLFRRTTVSWRHCFVFGLILLVIAIAQAIFGLSLAAILPPPLAIILGVAATLVVGGFFFSNRATTSAGVPIGLRGGTLLTALTIGMVLAVCLPLFLVVSAFLSGQP